MSAAAASLTQSSPIAAPNPAAAPRTHLPVLSVERLLREQRDLTAVEAFARKHDDGQFRASTKVYRSLIPLERPHANEQYAFEVDLDACTGCKACVAGCHELNGLDNTEFWRNVGLLHGGTVHAPDIQTVTTSCHHCVDPACMSGCPVKAYEKDPITGIVRHLDDQCIGCQYCTLMCPYDAPKYNPAKGIVRKCDMCSSRLADNEAPACVQSCPNEAITIRIVSRESVLDAANAQRFLPGAAAPEHTLPTTLYRTSRALPLNMLPADFYRTGPEHHHPPLVVMLTLTQLAVGAFAMAELSKHLSGKPVGDAVAQAAFAGAVGVLALFASVFHLGRPLYAWRAILGLRTSWLSREALALGAFVQLVLLCALAAIVPRHWPISAPLVARVPAGSLALSAVVAGLIGVFCSVMVYVATRRPQWSGTQTGVRFFGTTVILGAASVVSMASFAGEIDDSRIRALLWLIVLASGTKLLWEGAQLFSVRDPRHTVHKRMAKVMLGDLGLTTTVRFCCGLVGGVLLPWVSLGSSWSRDSGAALVTIAAVVLLVGELAERLLFFGAAPASRMPGGLR